MYSCMNQKLYACSVCKHLTCANQTLSRQETPNSLGGAKAYETRGGDGDDDDDDDDDTEMGGHRGRHMRAHMRAHI